MVMPRWARNPFNAALVASALALSGSPARADGNLGNVNHIIMLMQENHSFDNYFGVLPYVDNTPYHSAKGAGRHRACQTTDHACVDGLSCRVSKKTRAIRCKNSNPSTKGTVRSFHDPRYCTGPDLDHGWTSSHQEGNPSKPNNMLKSSPNTGFVRVNARTEKPDQATDHDTMGYYTDADLPFYYDLAETFAISDRYFASVIGPTFPNRAYLVAGTSFGHLTTNEIILGGGYRPLTGTIYDQLEAHGVSWTDYYSDLPYSEIFHVTVNAAHQRPMAMFATDAAAGTLPAVAFVDPSVLVDQPINGSNYETDEQPPADIRAGQYFVSQVITALRNSPSWRDSVLFLTYDEHGGFYDHVPPPSAPQGGAATPDGIAPGQCADASMPPASAMPGGGANCTLSKTEDAPVLCPAFTPTGPYPTGCATFNQLGFRLPLVAVSPFAKPHYVSHTVGSHTSFLALIEKRFSIPSLTARDTNSDDLEDMFDFDTSPSVNATIGTAPLPRQPPAFPAGDAGCPFAARPSGGL